MALCLQIPSQNGMPLSFFKSSAFCSFPVQVPITFGRFRIRGIRIRNLSMSIPCSIKTVRCPWLDKIIVKQKKIQFIQKLQTLLLSQPEHTMPLCVLSKYRSYLSLTSPSSILKMIQRFPAVFELNATNPPSQLCVRLTPAAVALAYQECNLKKHMSVTLAIKLQRLLMLSSHRRLLLSKLVALAPDLGLPPSFRSCLCNHHPDRFKIVDTSYGRAIELVSWDPNLAKPAPSPENHLELLVDRPPKFRRLRLRKGLNLKKRHEEFLSKLRDLPEICPYRTLAEELGKQSMEAEKRACAVVREVLTMTVEKRTLIDHLMYFRKDFGLPNKLTVFLPRHPDLFYVSIKGHRDSVFLVEGYDEKGVLLQKDEALLVKERLMELVTKGKRIRRERRNGYTGDYHFYNDGDGDGDDDKFTKYNDDEEVDYGFVNGDGFESLFDVGESHVQEDDDNGSVINRELLSDRICWSTDAPSN